MCGSEGVAVGFGVAVCAAVGAAVGFGVGVGVAVGCGVDTDGEFGESAGVLPVLGSGSFTELLLDDDFGLS
jgi:hypothetical protein